MTLYDKKFVYFDWDEKLEGKKGFFADNINDLKRNVKDNRAVWYGEIHENPTCDTHYPFGFIDESGNSHWFMFCYYDPYYEFRKAYLEGKQLQYKDRDSGDWIDVDGIPVFTTDEYRIKPEIIRWHVVLSDDGTFGITKDPQGKHVYFKGTEDECNEWIDEHEKFIGTMRAWEECKQIQYKNSQHSEPEWIDITLPTWEIHTEYRVKPDECKGCMKYDSCTNKNGIRCRNYCVEVEYVPFETLDELIREWESMNPGCTNRPKCAMPMIWVRKKAGNNVYLITEYYPEKYFDKDLSTSEVQLTLRELFEDYTFLDDSIIGKRG